MDKSNDDEELQHSDAAPANELDWKQLLERLDSLTESRDFYYAKVKEENQARKLTNSRQAINCDYIVKIEVDVEERNGYRPTSLRLLMNNQLSSHNKVIHCRVVINKEVECADCPKIGALRLLGFYDEIMNKRSGLVSIPYGLKLEGLNL
jgi:hypothetical protein